MIKNIYESDVRHFTLLSSLSIKTILFLTIKFFSTIMSSETLSNSLLRDLNRLYSDADDYDVNIQAGEGSNLENFKAHSNILQVRSTYFNAALSFNWAKKEGNIITFKKPNIKPNIFRIILKYIYTGTVTFDTNVIYNLGELLVAADEINLEELIDYIQKHIITLNYKLPEKNVIKLFNTLSSHQEVFKILYEYFKELISNNPKKFFNDFNLFPELENDALLSLIQNDYFKMEEIEIWNNLLKWAIVKNPTINSDTSLWKDKEIEVIKSTIYQFIPHIRFFQIPSDDYYDKIHPLSALLPEKLEKDINLHFILPESSLSSKVLPPRMNVDSRIIKMEHIYQIAHWIDRKQGKFSYFSRKFKYEFILLLRGSKDGYDVEPFKEKCYNKGATIVIIKPKENDKIIGGYNPINWSGSSKYLETNDSFIFSFHSPLNSTTTILSRVKNEENAIYDSMYDYHGFGDHDLRIFNKNNQKVGSAELYNNANNDHDVIVQIGKGSDSEFKAHSAILRVRSTYFNAANWQRKKEIIILKYIYIGAIDLNATIILENLSELLITVDEIGLNELFEYVLKPIPLCYQKLSEKKFLTILMIWDNLLNWIIAKNPTINSDTLLWKDKDIEYDKIHPLSSLLLENLEKDINLHFLAPESLLSSKVLPPRMSVDSRIIKMEHIYQIAHWIDRKEEKVSHSLRELSYEFNLLLRGSRDDFKVKTLKLKCYKKGATRVLNIEIAIYVSKYRLHGFVRDLQIFRNICILNGCEVE
ncbi:hypothetical protein C1645_872223 [Glomus cerebriforme]|uniref:BTB domain-containing protein n=1 Tax=Glomus cerebriforme TaxID=658196 RepID=A0A397TD32_9GLOM|nr:hypothetical protein C1645_872223 [Glomus cerebriforme]